MGLNTMTVSAPYNAVLNLNQRSFKSAGLRRASSFKSFDVVKVESNGILHVPTIDASRGKLDGVESAFKLAIISLVVGGAYLSILSSASSLDGLDFFRVGGAPLLAVGVPPLLIFKVVLSRISHIKQWRRNLSMSTNKNS